MQLFAAVVVTDDEMHEFFSDAEWEQERTDLDATMKEVASYDRVLIDRAVHGMGGEGG